MVDAATGMGAWQSVAPRVVAPRPVDPDAKARKSELQALRKTIPTARQKLIDEVPPCNPPGCGWV